MVADNAFPRGFVLTVSDRAAAGVYPDKSGPLVAAGLAELGFVVAPVVVVTDGEAVSKALRACIGAGAAVIITTGGTGLAPRDLTPEQTRLVIDREVPGIAERIRAVGAQNVPAAVLSRGIAGTAGTTLIVNLPGSTGAVRDGMTVLGPILLHVVDQVHGGNHG